MAADDHLFSTRPPWVELLVRRGRLTARLFRAPGGFVVRVIEGRTCRTKAGLIRTFARALAFPAYVGDNWDAFEEALNDLEWLPARGYLLIVSHAEEVGTDQEEDYATLIAILDAAGREWATPRTGQWPRPAVPFHSVLVVSPEALGGRAHWRLPRREAPG